MNKIKKCFSDYVMGTYTRSGAVFVKGKGSYLFDEDGKKYIDFFPGWGVGILGHAHSKVAKAIADQAKELIHVPNNLYSPNQALCAKELIKASFKKGKVFFCNSGAESVEAAIKLAKAYGKAKGRTEIIAMEKSFHGRTIGALSVTVQGKKQNLFKPLLSGIKSAKFNDFTSFKSLVTKKTAAVILEPIQGEGGVNIASKEYLQKVRDFCTKNDIVLIFDEVQTGMARTGKMFAYQYFGVEPDLFTLSKGLGAGFPIGCIVVSKKFEEVLKPGMHASTFGGSPLASKAVLAVLETIKEEKVLQNVKKKEKVLATRLGALKDNCKCVKDVRGVGLMWAVELNTAAKPVYDALMEKKMITNVSHETIMRIMPALNIDDKAFDKGLTMLEKAIISFDKKI